jgi:formylglycine-generating enzyme required for sulfatase activity
VVVPAGSFTMGAAKGSKILLPQHDVIISRPFAVGQFAVTFDEWDACVNDGGCGGYRPPDEGWGRGQRPVINVSWNDAKAYVAWLSRKTAKSYRLLTEAEREYVTRAGTHTPFWWGSSISTKQANYDGTLQAASTNTVKVEPGEYRQKTVPVNTFAANPFGLYQVHGNVLEWTEDCFHVGYAGAPIDGSAWTSDGACDDDAHVVRGGSWDEPWTFALSEFRGKGLDRSNIIGLRVARTLQAPERRNSVLVRQELESAIDSYADGEKVAK